MCRKAPKARYFVLFNDSLLYGTIIKDKTAQRHVVCAKPVLLPLGSMTITPLSDERTSEDSGWLNRAAFAVHFMLLRLFSCIY